MNGKAEAEATEIIDAGVYSLEDPVNAFIPQSNETILQVYIQQGLKSDRFRLPAACTRSYTSCVSERWFRCCF